MSIQITEKLVVCDVIVSIFRLRKNYDYTNKWRYMKKNKWDSQNLQIRRRLKVWWRHNPSVNLDKFHDSNKLCRARGNFQQENVVSWRKIFDRKIGSSLATVKTIGYFKGISLIQNTFKIHDCDCYLRVWRHYIINNNSWLCDVIR